MERIGDRLSDFARDRGFAPRPYRARHSHPPVLHGPHRPLPGAAAAGEVAPGGAGRGGGRPADRPCSTSSNYLAAAVVVGVGIMSAFSALGVDTGAPAGLGRGAGLRRRLRRPDDGQGPAQRAVPAGRGAVHDRRRDHRQQRQPASSSGSRCGRRRCGPPTATSHIVPVRRRAPGHQQVQGLDAGRHRSRHLYATPVDRALEVPRDVLQPVWPLDEEIGAGLMEPPQGGRRDRLPGPPVPPSSVVTAKVIPVGRLGSRSSGMMRKILRQGLRRREGIEPPMPFSLLPLSAVRAGREESVCPGLQAA